MTHCGAAKRILALTPQFPYPPHQGTTLRNYNIVASLALRHEVHLLSFGDLAEDQSTPLHAVCQSVMTVPPPTRSMRQRLLDLVFSRLPDMAQRLPSLDFQSALASLLEREDFDVVQVEGIELAQYLFQVVAWRGSRGRPLLVFEDHNAEYVLQQRAFETDLHQFWPPGGLSQKLGAMARGRRWIGAAYSFVQWRRLQAYERRACLAADQVVAVSDADAEALCRLVPGLEPTVVPNGVDVAFYTSPLPPLPEPSGPSARDLVFTGKMDFRPNVDGVLWFAQEVLPLIHQEEPGVRLWVVGKDPHPRLAPLVDNPAVVVTGWVQDVRPYISGAAVYVVPLRIGGGTRLKVLEALAMRKAVVSTTVGCEGFELIPGQDIITADGPEDFAASVVALLREPERREQLGQAGYRFAESGYDWRTIVPRLEQVYDRLAAEPCIEHGVWKHQ